jgi:hypothetical protein
MRIKVVACFATGHVQVPEIFAGFDFAVWQLPVEFGDNDCFVLQFLAGLSLTKTLCSHAAVAIHRWNRKTQATSVT